MGPVTCSPRSGLQIRQRVLLLTQRWLPMLLSRIGVSKLEVEKLRTLVDADELEADLAEARAAVKLRGCARGERHEQVYDALETISKLGLALEIASEDPPRAHALVDEVDRRWLRIVLFGAKEQGGEISSNARSSWAASEFRAAPVRLH